MLLAAHQPNFCPWMPYFDKMNKADVFIILVNCQFEKNGYQNRARVFDEWWTMPVRRGLQLIKEKRYTNDENLVTTNILWITAIAKTLGIDTKKLHMDFETDSRGTDRIIEICKFHKCNQYLTNMDAIEKYLDVSKMKKAKIELVPHETIYKKHVFEMFDQYGIDGTQKILKREKENAESRSIL